MMRAVMELALGLRAFETDFEGHTDAIGLAIGGFLCSRRASSDLWKSEHREGDRYFVHGDFVNQ